MNSKIFLFLIGATFSNACLAQLGGEVLRKADGSIRYMTHYEATGVNRWTGIQENADVFDAAGKGRLPTARELAQESQRRGAKGILEAEQVERNHIDYLKYIQSYYKIARSYV